MKPYLVTTGTIFALITLVHFWRMMGENHQLASDPVFLALTVLSAFLSGWAFALLRRSRA
jgi:hypothetical protein